MLALLLAGLLLLQPMPSATPSAAARGAASGSNAVGDSADFSERQAYLVRYDRGRVAPRAGSDAGTASARAADIIAARTNGRIIRQLERRDVIVTELNADEAARLREDPEILSVTPERTVTTLLDEALPVVRADDVSLTSLANPVDGTGTVVVIIDNGVDRDHPFFADAAGNSRVVDEVCFSSTGHCPTNTTTMTGTGAAAPLQGSSHGTQVAGIAVGRQEVGRPRRGVSGGAELLAAQVFGVYPADNGGTEQRATTGDLLAALDWAVAQAATRPIRAVNLSVGGGLYPGDCDELDDSGLFLAVIDELRSLGVLTIAASGNSGATSGQSWPACLSNVVSVTATDNDTVLAPFSNASVATDLAAPGSPVTSSSVGGGFDAVQGTSMAAPMVSGAVALLAQMVPGADAAALESAIRTTQTYIDDTRLGGGVTGIALLDVVTAASTLAPSAPRFPAASVLSYDITASGDLAIGWPAASGTGQLRYEVHRDGSRITTTTGRNLTVTGLRTGRDYRFEVRALDAYGQRSDPIARILTPATGFRDTQTSMFRRDIDWLATGRITRGCNPPTNDRFCPSDPVTRAQMAAFLVRALGLSETSGVRFRDVPRNSTFERDIDRLATAGITRGCNPPTNDRFCPSDPVTRGQMAAFLTRGLELRDTSGVRFSDVLSLSLFSRDIDRLATAGITRGCNPPTNDRFCPRDPVTRGQMAAFLRRGLT